MNSIPASSPPDDVPVGCRMYSRLSLVLRFLGTLLFGKISYSQPEAEAIKHLSDEGTLVYITRGNSPWLAFCFNHLLRRAHVPLPQFIGGVNALLLQPLGVLFRMWRLRRASVALPEQFKAAGTSLTRSEALLAREAFEARPTFVALPVARTGRGLWPDVNDYIRALIAVQLQSARPLWLAPHVLVAREQSGGSAQSLLDRLLGDPSRPGSLRHATMLWTLRRGAMRTAQPLNLKEWLGEQSSEDPRLLARALRTELHRRMDEEERVVAGPPLAALDHLLSKILQDKLVRQTIENEARAEGPNDLALELAASRSVRQIAARYNVQVIRAMEVLLWSIFNRIYDGLVTDEVGLAKVIEASRRAPVVFCPSHRSHIDYLVLSFVLWTHGVAPPHIAAGANLSFFPLGLLFRRCGAFFLRRSFRSDSLYGAVFSAYLKELLKAGTSIEFFLEGTRSRTGKLLMPKFGLLGMIVNAWRQKARDDILFVPVSIDYERIIEAQSYQRELGGADKRAEDITGLLKTTRVLRSRYGRVALQFGAPISLAEIANHRALNQSFLREDDETWRLEVERLGYRIMHEVAMVGSVTPTSIAATVLLGHSGRGISQGRLLEASVNCIQFLEGEDARLSGSLGRSETRVSAILEATQKLVDERVIESERAGDSDMEPIYRVRDERRVSLDYHKNAVMNYFAPCAVVARALCQERDKHVFPMAYLTERVRTLSHVLKKEFLFRGDVAPAQSFTDVLSGLALRGLIDVVDADENVVVRDRRGLMQLSDLLDNFVEGYWVTAKTLLDLRLGPMDSKACMTRCLERARRAFLEGDISRPEAANRTLVEGALRWLESDRIIVRETKGRNYIFRFLDESGAENLEKIVCQIDTFRSSSGNLGSTIS